MELATIEMNKGKAREAFLDYRRAVLEGGGAEDEQIMRGYRELAKGRRLINLRETLRAGGTTEISVPPRWRPGGPPRPVRVPALAVARADATYCWTFGVGSTGSVELRGKRELHIRNRRDRLILPVGTFDDGPELYPEWIPRLHAMVPVIPPALRPARRLGLYHLLWEAEWRVDTSPPPGDPALLKHVGGDLYAVLAIWDLTPLEQAVLAGRTPTEV